MQSAGTVPAFDVRISIEDTEPLIWRRLKVPASLTVAEFHLAVQAAFGWENRHLYAVRCVDPAGKVRVIMGPDDALEDLDAEPASAVVLSDLLDAEAPTSALEYDYDFGDSWTHQVQLLGSAELPAGELVCVDGANRGPVEDSGGPHGYRRLVGILGDPTHPEHQDAAFWTYRMAGIYGPKFDASAFDIAAANRKLRLLSLQWWPQPLTDEERDAVIRPVHWLLEQAAGDGIELTKDGYLRPVMVKQAMEELGWSGPIMGKGNREAHAQPVRELREHLLEWKLLRKLKSFTDQTEVIKGALQAAGFVTRSGHPIPDDWVTDIYRTVRWKLGCLHLLAPDVRYLDSGLLTDGGAKFLLEVRQVEREFSDAK